jgi:hypothetical protein
LSRKPPFAVLVVSVALAGCGGGGGTTEGPPPLSRPQLVKRLDAICQEHTDRQVAARERFDAGHGIASPEDATLAQYEQEIVEVILPIVRDTIHDLERVHPAASDEAELDAFIGALKRSVATTQADPNKLAAEEGEEPFSGARAAAGSLGAYLCGQA